MIHPTMPLDPEAPRHAENTPAERRAAALQVCACARDADDAALLLDALGLR